MTRVIADACRLLPSRQVFAVKIWSLSLTIHRPILTYGGKGCNRSGTKAEKHGIIYDARGKARLLSSEPRLGFPSIRLVIEAEGESLAKASRVNYSKIVTVEHYVNVFFIGHIRPDDLPIVSDAVNACWEPRVRSRRKISDI